MPDDDQMWFRLTQELLKESDILGERITPQYLKELHELGFAIAHYEKDVIVGFAALWPTSHHEWRELGSVWVHSQWRGRGIASEVFALCMKKSMINSTRVLMVTHHPKVAHLAKKALFKEATCTTWETLPWEVTCGPCDRFRTDEEKRTCPFKAKQGKCTLFFV